MHSGLKICMVDIQKNMQNGQEQPFFHPKTLKKHWKVIL